MSSRVTQVLLGLSLLLNAFVLAGFVFNTWFEPERRPFAHRPSPGHRWPNPLELLAQDLKLDDAQKTAVQPIIDEYGNSRRERWRDIGKIREEMSAELQKPSFDWAKVDGLVDQMAVLRAEQQKQNLRSVEQMASKLTPDKQAELHKMLGERYGGRRSGPRPPRPPQ
jgi:Spy/CpxP family protein refolding chaperone